MAEQWAVSTLSAMCLCEWACERENRPISFRFYDRFGLQFGFYTSQINWNEKRLDFFLLLKIKKKKVMLKMQNIFGIKANFQPKKNEH